MKPFLCLIFRSKYLGIYFFKRNRAVQLIWIDQSSMSKALKAPILLIFEVYSIAYQYLLVYIENSFLFISLNSTEDAASDFIKSSIK